MTEWERALGLAAALITVIGGVFTIWRSRPARNEDVHCEVLGFEKSADHDGWYRLHLQVSNASALRYAGESIRVLAPIGTVILNEAAIPVERDVPWEPGRLMVEKIDRAGITNATKPGIELAPSGVKSSGLIIGQSDMQTVAYWMRPSRRLIADSEFSISLSLRSTDASRRLCTIAIKQTTTETRNNEIA